MPGGRTQRLAEALVSEQRRVDAVGEGPDLRQCRVDLLAERSEAGTSRLRIGLERLIGQLELDAEGDEPLLGAAVRIALDPAPLGNARAATQATPSTASLLAPTRRIRTKRPAARNRRPATTRTGVSAIRIGCVECVTRCASRNTTARNRNAASASRSGRMTESTNPGSESRTKKAFPGQPLSQLV
jgi:hypothetical protein